MRQENTYTTEGSRFFYPEHEEVEHHSSLDTSKLPSVTILTGLDHYVVIERDREEVAHELLWNESNIPSEATIKQVAPIHPAAYGHPKARAAFLESTELEILDRTETCYVPAVTDRVVVQVDKEAIYQNRGNENLGNNGILLLPSYSRLPGTKELGLSASTTEVRYALLGFVTVNNQLIVPNSITSNQTRKSVDWCIANVLAQSGLEQALLRDALDVQSPKKGRISRSGLVSEYLAYFDTRNATGFHDHKEPSDQPHGFASLNASDRMLLQALSRAASRAKGRSCIEDSAETLR